MVSGYPLLLPSSPTFRATLALAIYTFTHIPGGEISALRLTLIAVVVSMAALIASELLGRQLARRIEA